MSDEQAAAAVAQAETTTAEVPSGDGAAGSPSAPAASPWDTLPDDAKGYVANKGWKGPADLLESYRNLERLRGVPPEKLLRLPDDPKEMGAVYDRLGRPESADKYTPAVPEEHRDAVFSEMASAAYEAGLSDAQFKGLQGKFVEVSEKLMTERQEAVARGLDEWQREHPRDFDNVRALSKQVGISEEDMASALKGDAAAFYGVLAKVASQMGEGQAVTGDVKPGFKMTPAQAQAKLDSMMGDEAYTKRLFHDDPKVRMAAASEKSHLHAIIAEAKGSTGDRVSELEAENMRLRAQARSVA